MMALAPIGLPHYLSLSALLFALAVTGIFLNRKNIIVLLMAIELSARGQYELCGLLALFERFAWPDFCLLHHDRGRSRSRHRLGDSGLVVPQQVFDQP